MRGHLAVSCHGELGSCLWRWEFASGMSRPVAGACGGALVGCVYVAVSRWENLVKSPVHARRPDMDISRQVDAASKLYLY